VVLDPPEAPLHRSKPKRTRMVILAGLIGLCLGVVIGFVMEYTQNSDLVEQEKMGKAKSLFFKNILELIPGISNKKK